MKSLSPPLSRRIEVIDVLRGFSLLGIIIVHMVEQYYAGPMPEAITQANPGSIVDNIFAGIAGIFIMGKFYMIFSFLFGLSFFIQSSNKESDGTFLLRFTWRLILLFGIGMLHHIHYRGDILGIYAVLGLGLLLFYKASDKVLLITGLVLVFNLPSVFLRIFQAVFDFGGNPFTNLDQRELMAHFDIIKNGTYAEILKSNLITLPSKATFQIFSGRIFITFGLFLLGFYAGRKRFFEKLEEHTIWIKRMMNYSWKSIIAVGVIMAGFFGAIYILKLGVPSAIQFAVGGFGYDIFNAGMSFIYIGAVVLLFQREKWHNRLMYFYEVGRMGLTTYLVQSLFGMIIFTNVGFGLIGDVGSAIWFVGGIILFVTQIGLSKIWFRYFHYGLFEWIWRSLTYFKVQKLAKRTQLIPQA